MNNEYELSLIGDITRQRITNNLGLLILIIDCWFGIVDLTFIQNKGKLCNFYAVIDCWF